MLHATPQVGTRANIPLCPQGTAGSYNNLSTVTAESDELAVQHRSKDMSPCSNKTIAGSTEHALRFLGINNKEGALEVLKEPPP